MRAGSGSARDASDVHHNGRAVEGNEVMSPYDAWRRMSEAERGEVRRMREAEWGQRLLFSPGHPLEEAEILFGPFRRWFAWRPVKASSFATKQMRWAFWEPIYCHRRFIDGRWLYDVDIPPP
jgi:hypothetical protein